VNKLLRVSLAIVWLTLLALPGLGRAGTGGYVALPVPDVQQATAFFHDVMNCAVVSESTGAHAAPSTLMDCGGGTIVELTGGTARQNGAMSAAPAVVFVTDNAVAAASWLRANHVAVVGQPLRMAEGVDMDRIAVDFVTPWGQPMQLVSHAPAEENVGGTRLVVQ
jgi:catechol 2,3-dioxygenase-like lactoylglutathione lyase family enzyme